MTAHNLKKRRDTIVAAFVRMSAAFSNGSSITREEIFDDADADKKSKNRASSTLRILCHFGYAVRALGKYKIVKEIPLDNEDLVQCCLHWRYGMDLPTSITPTPGNDFSALPSGDPEIGPESTDEPDGNPTELPETASDPIAALLAVPGAVLRIEARLGTIERRLMAITEIVEGLHKEWTGGKI